MSHKLDTLYYGDNLGWMRQWSSGFVDLIYLDPPFNSDEDKNAIFSSGAQVRAYKDTWKWGSQAITDRDNALTTTPAISKVVRGFEEMLPQTPMLAYLCHLAPRLYEIHRLLKETGSLYLHCDDTSGHYIKILLDAVFGPEQYQNSIIWRRATAHNDANRYGRITDHIFFYTKTGEYTWNGEAIAEPKTEENLAVTYPSEDGRGRYYSGDLTGPLHKTKKGAPSTQPWKRYDVYERGRCWSVPKVGNGKYAEYIQKNFIPNYGSIEGLHDRLDALDKAGLIHHPKEGVWPGLKRYADADQGIPPQNLILKPIGFTNYSARRRKNGQGEYLGWDTQKPEALIRKFIKVSSNPGDVVLDPYCGCGTTVHVCRDIEGAGLPYEPSARRFIGIDLTHLSIGIIEHRFQTRLGERPKVIGAPEDLDAAQNLFDRDPFQFEAWAISRIDGLLPNERKTGDRGVDGRGYTADQDPLLVLAQVKGGKNITPSMARDFVGTLHSEKAVLGILVVMSNALITQGVKSALAQDNVKIGERSYPKFQIFSIEDYFSGRKPNIPSMLERYTGRQNGFNLNS